MPVIPSITLPLWHGLAPKWPTELAFLAQYRAKRLFNAAVHQPLVPRLSEAVFGRIEQPLTLADADLVQTLQARLEWLELHALNRFYTPPSYIVEGPFDHRVVVDIAGVPYGQAELRYKKIADPETEPIDNWLGTPLGDFMHTSRPDGSDSFSIKPAHRRWENGLETCPEHESVRAAQVFVNAREAIDPNDVTALHALEQQFLATPIGTLWTHYFQV